MGLGDKYTYILYKYTYKCVCVRVYIYIYLILLPSHGWAALLKDKELVFFPWVGYNFPVFTYISDLWATDRFTAPFPQDRQFHLCQHNTSVVHCHFPKYQVNCYLDPLILLYNYILVLIKQFHCLDDIISAFFSECTCPKLYIFSF